MGRCKLKQQKIKYYGNGKQNKNMENKVSKNTEKTYKCVICPYKAKNKLLLQYHALDFHKTCKKVNVLKCSMCTYKTLVQQNLFVHVKKHREEENLLHCANCPFKVKFKSSLISHMTRHFLNAKFKCLFCSYSSNHQSATNSHQWIHPEYSRNTVYQCIHCPYMTRIKSHFERHCVVHKRVSINEDVSVFKCTFCPFNTFYKSSLDRHNLAHSRKKGVQCKNCSYTAKTLGGLALHTKYQCRENKPEGHVIKKHKCTTCSYQTNKPSHYSRHLSTHEDSISRYPFKCILCTFKCSSNLILDRHFSSHHTKADLQCSKCSFFSNRLASLNTHMLSIHQDKFQEAKLFSCSSCSYTTIKQSDLNRHVTRHQKSTEISWIFCNECPFKAKRKYRLADHCKRHKLAEGIKCSYCTYRSSSQITSWNHIKLHL